jgi:hypothetical protein
MTNSFPGSSLPADETCCNGGFYVKWDALFISGSILRILTAFEVHSEESCKGTEQMKYIRRDFIRFP